MGIKMKKTKMVWAILAATALLAGAACTDSGSGGAGGGGGGGDKESQFASALSALNPDWQLYEIGESRGAPTIKVEVNEIVNFQDAKKAVEAISKVDPKFAGYIDFYDAKTGTVVRKMEIIPAQGGK